MTSLQGRIAVVTGGASGIGLACAELLAARGAMVVVADRDHAGATRAASACGGRAYAVDVGVSGALESLAQLVESEVGPVDMLISAAGILQGAMLRPEEIADDTYERVFRINLLGTYAACTAFGSRMAKRRKGSIVLLASVSGLRSTPLHAYGPMKAAVIQLTENLATEWGRSGVRVNCLSPGPVLTPAMQLAIDAGQRDRALLERSCASGKIVAPLEVAQAAAFLLSDEASAITGVNLPVDHGWLVASSWMQFGGVRDAQ